MAIATELDAPIERVFFPSSDCYVYATNCLDVRLQVPFYGWVLISIDGEPIHIRTGGTEFAERAMALWARDVQFLVPPSRFVTVAVNPFHRLFRAFTKIAEPSALVLDYAAFAELRTSMVNALTSPRFAHAEALELKQRVLEIAGDTLPKVPSLDARAQRLMKLLCDNPRCTLSDLAQNLKLSYHRTSHLFTQAVGITVRTYQLWQKLYRANGPLTKGATLTEAAHAAGFVDSAHYSNAYFTAYGRSPRDAFKARRFVVYLDDAFTESAIGEALRKDACG